MMANIIEIQSSLIFNSVKLTHLSQEAKLNSVYTYFHPVGYIHGHNQYTLGLEGVEISTHAM